MILAVLHGVSGAGRAVATAVIAVPGQVTLAAIDLVVERVERAGIPLRVAERMLADGIAEQVAARLLEGPELERIAKLTVESPALHAAVADALDSEAMERLLARVLETEGVQRLVTQVLESRVVEDAVARLIDDAAARLPDSEAMWALIDVIARSPAVTDAIAQQGVGFADQVADEVRDRSRTVDDRLERGARRLLRRRPRPFGGGGGAPASGTA
jgi:hypothetical protein